MYEQQRKLVTLVLVLLSILGTQNKVLINTDCGLSCYQISTTVITGNGFHICMNEYTRMNEYT